MRSNMTDSAQKDDSACTENAAAMVLNTRELESTEGRTRWADTLDSTYCEMDVDWPDRDAQFAAELTVRPFGELTVSVVHADPHTVVRTPEMIRSDPNDDYLLCLITRGTATLEQHSRTAVLEQGAFGILDSAAPFVVDGKTEFEQVVLRAPRQLLISRLSVEAMGEVTGLGISGQRGMSGLVSRFLVDIATTDARFSVGSSASVAASAVDLLTSALTEQAPPLTATNGSTTTTSGRCSRRWRGTCTTPITRRQRSASNWECRCATSTNCSVSPAPRPARGCTSCVWIARGDSSWTPTRRSPKSANASVSATSHTSAAHSANGSAPAPRISASNMAIRVRTVRSVRPYPVCPRPKI